MYFERRLLVFVCGDSATNLRPFLFSDLVPGCTTSHAKARRSARCRALLLRVLGVEAAGQFRRVCGVLSGPACGELRNPARCGV